MERPSPSLSTDPSFYRPIIPWRQRVAISHPVESDSPGVVTLKFLCTIPITLSLSNGAESEPASTGLSARFDLPQDGLRQPERVEGSARTGLLSKYFQVTTLIQLT